MNKNNYDIETLRVGIAALIASSPSLNLEEEGESDLVYDETLEWLQSLSDDEIIHKAINEGLIF